MRCSSRSRGGPVLVAGRAVQTVELAADLLGNFGSGHNQRQAAGQRRDLRLAGALQIEHGVEGVRHAGAADQQAVVAQDHRAVGAEIGDQALLLVHVERDAFVVVIADAVVKAHGMLRNHEQASLLRGHRDAGRGMRMHDAGRVVADAMDGAMDDEAGGVDAQAGLVQQDAAVDVHLDQVGRGDLVEHQAVGIDQEVRLGAGNPGRDMRIDVVGHAHFDSQVVGRGEIHAHCPFLGRNLVLDRCLLHGSSSGFAFFLVWPAPLLRGLFQTEYRFSSRCRLSKRFDGNA